MSCCLTRHSISPTSGETGMARRVCPTQLSAESSDIRPLRLILSTEREETWRTLQDVGVSLQCNLDLKRIVGSDGRFGVLPQRLGDTEAEEAFDLQACRRGGTTGEEPRRRQRARPPVH